MGKQWEHELEVAVKAVRAAVGVCRTVQHQLATPEKLEKKDRSPVTVADFASQAVVCAQLAQAFGDDPIIAEEDSAELRKPERAAIRQVVVGHVAAGMGQELDEAEVMDWIDLGGAGASGGGLDRFWTLDPIDGTKGFLRREQYAVALSLVEHGRVVLGVLGCPNLPLGDRVGAVFVAVQGGGAGVLPLDGSGASEAAAAIHVSAVASPDGARFCESVESAHSSHSDSDDIAHDLGMTSQPLRMDSQAKYATVARGDASIYLRLPTRADYQEMIWDHAAGAIVVTEAGGRVTDIAGQPLDFTHGRTLVTNRGIVATNGTLHEAVLNSVTRVMGRS